MPRLRHFAVCVSDLDKSAKFYGDVFGMKRHGREDLSIGSAVYMGDGTINLALLNFVGNQGHDFGDNPGEDRERAGDPERVALQRCCQDKIEPGGEQQRADRHEQVVAAADQPEVLVAVDRPGWDRRAGRGAFHGVQAVALRG